VDWKASARHDRFYVKRYVEDRSLAVRLVLDCSASMLQATAGLASKYRLAGRMAACLAYLVVKERDAVGVTLTSAAGTVAVPVSSRANHMPQILAGPRGDAGRGPGQPGGHAAQPAGAQRDPRHRRPGLGPDV